MEKRTIQFGGRPESESCFIGWWLSVIGQSGKLCDYIKAVPQRKFQGKEREGRTIMCGLLLKASLGSEMCV